MNRYFLGLLALATSATCFGISPFQLPWMNHPTPGTLYSSATRPDTVYLLEPYFLNCPYCHQNAPHVEEMAKAFANEPRVQVLDIGIDRLDSQYKTWIAMHRPNHPVLKDDKRAVVRQLGTTSYPSSYVVDCKGAVRYSTSSVWSMTTEAAIKNVIVEVLKEKCSQ